MKSTDIRAELSNAGLAIPPGLEELLVSMDELSFINGVGGEGSWFNFLIPKRIKKVNITAAAILHDYRYYVGDNLADFLRANRLFINDILFQLDRYGLEKDYSLARIRTMHRGAWKFFYFVDHFGLRFFVTERNQAQMNNDIKATLIERIKQEIKDKQDLGTGDMY